MVECGTMAHTHQTESDDKTERCDRCGKPSDNALCPRCERILSEVHTYGWADDGRRDVTH
jgi:predicted amidophosphoribosyltransferase